ncbi:TlpA family protein disulfide reductase, partial [candidate division KSB1 bacterium]|nr:TlpA family protein disulfide reductase [candidate division KSB1 bacterium]
PRYLDKWPPLAEQYDITSEECKAILDNFAQNSKNPLTRETVIYELQSRYAQMDSTALVEQYQKMLYDEFPDGFAVQELDRQKNSFSWQRVAPYPALDFSIKTLDGDDIKLSDYRGRFVLIDFWGSWCGPCRQEIPNIVNMVTMLPNDKLQVIGLAKDEEKDLRKYLDKNSLPYPNALVDDELLKAWNIQYYPSNFLINPHGEVIAKDIRGPKMGLEIGVEIAKWQF